MVPCLWAADPWEKRPLDQRMVLLILQTSEGFESSEAAELSCCTPDHRQDEDDGGDDVDGDDDDYDDDDLVSSLGSPHTSSPKLPCLCQN